MVGVHLAHTCVFKTILVRDFKFAGSVVQKSYLVMVGLTLTLIIQDDLVHNIVGFVIDGHIFTYCGFIPNMKCIFVGFFMLYEEYNFRM